MKPYAVLVGTAKSNDEEGRYLEKRKFKEVLWDPLQEVFNVEFNPKQPESFTDNTGVDFYDIIPPELQIEGNDQRLFAHYFNNPVNLNQLNQALSNFKQYLETNKIRYVAFNGMQPAGLFFYFLEKKPENNDIPLEELLSPENGSEFNYQKIFRNKYKDLSKCCFYTSNTYGRINQNYFSNTKFFCLHTLSYGSVRSQLTAARKDEWKEFWRIVKANPPMS